MLLMNDDKCTIIVSLQDFHYEILYKSIYILITLLQIPVTNQADPV